MMAEIILFVIYSLGIIFIFVYALSWFAGGGFAPTPYSKINEIFDLVKITKNDLVVDLGSGDGRVLIAAGKRGIRSIGFEVNPFFYLISLLLIYFFHLKKFASVKWGDFWNKDISKASVVFIYLPVRSRQLEEKLKKELAKGTRVVTFSTGFPTWKPKKITPSGIFLFTV